MIETDCHNASQFKSTFLIFWVIVWFIKIFFGHKKFEWKGEEYILGVS